MGEREQAIHTSATNFDKERGELETLLGGEYFSKRGGGLKFLIRDLESTRESLVTLLETGFPEGTAREVGRIGGLVSLYGDRLERLNEALADDRDQQEQRIRVYVQGTMSTNFDDFYEMEGALRKSMRGPQEDIDSMTQESTRMMREQCGRLAERQIQLSTVLAEIGRSRAELDALIQAQVLIVRVRIAAFMLEQDLNVLRVHLDGNHIAITED